MTKTLWVQVVITKMGDYK